MIGKLKGKLDSSYIDHIILDVSGVGYLVFCSGRTLAMLEPLAYIELFIQTHVREDHIQLYGFLALDEKNTFNILQSVKGVGTKMALNILSFLTPIEIQHALNRADKAIFCNISGIGKKLAERIITELKDKSLTSAELAMQELGAMVPKIATPEKEMADDAVSALINLGITKNEAINRVNNIISNNANINLSELIRLSLQK
jgi:Holliday junction DNA helicase RuvA